MMSGESKGVHLEHVYRSYGKTRVLHDVNINLPRGQIYGLLGPSGCGKTTTMKVILGLLAPDSGIVRSLGKAPGAHLHNVPGNKVGYMPQELAVFEEFSLHENLLYYSKLYNMSDEDFENQEEYLVDFLKLPDKDRVVRTFSGGEQRRVSLALALLPSPELLLLDEPTVGVDPVLRTKIWEMMTAQAKRGTTIIVTTHYIEEARQAHMVGFMRAGRILDEGDPTMLIAKHHQSNLENTFLYLCENFDASLPSDGKVSNSSSATKRALQAAEVPLMIDVTDDVVVQDPVPLHIPCCTAPRYEQTMALNYKNINRLRRNMALLMFQFMLPAFQVLLFCLAIGRNPVGLKLGVVNQDEGFLGYHFGDDFTQNLDKNFHLVDFETDIHAEAATLAGHNWGYVSIPINYTTCMIERQQNPTNTSQGVLIGSTITYRLDMSNEQITVVITQDITTAYEELLMQLSGGESLNLPLASGEPVYGDKSWTFSDFIAPGMIVTISFIQAISLTALNLVYEKKTKNQDRMFSTGVNSAEVMLSQIMTQIVILAVQVALLLTVALAVFELPMEGNLLLAASISFASGLTGMMYGLFVSSVSDDERTALQLGLGTFFPALLLSGVIWPLEGIPVPLVYISYSLPTTWTAEAMRSIFSRGWDLTYSSVYYAFIFTAGYTLLFFLMSQRKLRARN